MTREGRVQRRLRALLEAEGFDIDFFMVAKGHYRTSVHADCFRWEAYGFRPGSPLRIWFCSYETMSACVKRGIRLVPDGGFTIDVLAKDAPGT